MILILSIISLTRTIYLSQQSPTVPISPTQTRHSKSERHSMPKRPRSKPVTLITDSTLTNELIAPNGTTETDIELLNSLLHLYRRALGGNPVGLNEEITSELTGQNSKGAAVLPADHPSINDRGELTDRWGTPYFFHALSGTQMEIRSAGTDRKLYTDDDILSHP